MGLLNFNEVAFLNGRAHGLRGGFDLASAFKSAGPTVSHIVVPWTAYTDVQQAKAEGKAKQQEILAQAQVAQAQTAQAAQDAANAAAAQQRVIAARQDLDGRLTQIHSDGDSAGKAISALRDLVQNRGVDPAYAAQGAQYEQVLMQIMGDVSQNTPVSSDPAVLEGAMSALSNAGWAVAQIRSELEDLARRATSDADSADAARAAAVAQAVAQAKAQAQAAPLIAARARTNQLNLWFQQQQKEAAAWWDLQQGGAV